MPWKICFTLPTNPPRRICVPIPLAVPVRLLRRWPWPPPPPPDWESWLEDPRVKDATVKDLVTLNVMSDLATDLSPAVRKSVLGALESNLRDLKLPADYTLHAVEK
jgi:hypothetical protein